MGIYEKHVLPWGINLAMRNPSLTAERAKFVPLATGTVLEIGIGSGLNIPFYSRGVKKLYALDPSERLRGMAARRAVGAPFAVEFIGLSAENIPLDGGAVDTVLTTWTLCGIEDAGRALKETRRVLKPGGKLVFVEHGRSPDAGVLAWQNRLTPMWKRIGGGCHLNRPIDAMIKQAGFSIDRIETGYIKGPRPFTFLFKGLASPD